MADLNPSAQTLERRRENWGTKLGVILAVSGSAVGLGNFLRFPGLAATHGGGMFMIPYFISLLLLGIPLVWAEWAMGRYGGARGYNSAPGIYSVIWPRPWSRYFGALALMVPIVIYMYYVYIESWCLYYAWSYLRAFVTGNRGVSPGESVEQGAAFFSNYVQDTQNGLPGPAIAMLILVFLLNYVFIYRGVTRGIETFSRYAMPLLVLCALVVLVRVLTLPNILDGLGFMWNPSLPEGQSTWDYLKNAEVWLLAAGQIFFSISVGFGIIINYASYLRRNDDVVLSGMTACATNEFCEVCLGGLITIPVAFIFLGGLPEGLLRSISEGSSLAVGFFALPPVFGLMPLGLLFGALWFFMLSLAAITSSLSMLQPTIAFLEEGMGLGRRAAVALLGLLTAIGCLIAVYFSKNLAALDTMDFWVGSVCIYVLATIQVLMFGWAFGIERARAEIAQGAEMKVPAIFWPVIRYVTPVYLLVIFLFWAKQKFPERIRGIVELDAADRAGVLFPLIYIGLLILFFVIMIALTRQRMDRLRVEEHAREEVVP
ncbi:MAG TPA: sodium-dependent transporter [Candidatus Sumerlaeota bacterium]|nr:MAG: Sodium:neurotransmitter symporter family protein [candidate division BRC1 bacterium ADurb.BinA292]HOE95071.1 sodium-dependent transporter [Candidatus Sumerlaeota bacterium]HOR26430.1 sodium-dependent transporter [Candidatus Sumerlaeota bacterium]HPK02831.1 sodium-dependent transporter [Candidatus Sumerlaeota bacterium]